MTTSQPSQTIDRYEVLSTLGQGGFGAVFIARHLMTGREVALKVSDPHGDPELVTRALNEARIAATCRHPSLVEIYDCGVLPDGRVFVAMERVVGESLDAILEREGGITTERAVRLAAQVLSALEVVHARGVVHRDIKPANLLIQRTAEGAERVVVIDFGISKVLDPSHAISQPGTMAGAILGTPGYMPPEQLDARSVDARADLYSVGALLFRALSGKVLFECDTLAAWFVAVTQAPTPTLASVAPWVAPSVCAVVDRALARDRDARPQSAHEMRAWLEASLRGSQAISQPADTLRSAVSPQSLPPQPTSQGAYAPTSYAKSSHDSVAYAQTSYVPSVAPSPRSSVAYAQQEGSLTPSVAHVQPTLAAHRVTSVGHTARTAGLIAGVVVVTAGVVLSITEPWAKEPEALVATTTEMPHERANTNAVSEPLAEAPTAPTQAPSPPPRQITAPTGATAPALTPAPAAREENERSDVALLRSPSGRVRLVQTRPVGDVDMAEAIGFFRRALPAIESCYGGDGAAQASVTMMFRPAMRPLFSQPASTGGALARCVEMAIETSNPGMRDGTHSSGILADISFAWGTSS
ncbi:MAG: protein kinase [Deltaproteobacteria bacterium]|nr:protein kinase [Deltaproteobacteria bacterium]